MKSLKFRNNRIAICANYLKTFDIVEENLRDEGENDNSDLTFEYLIPIEFKDILSSENFREVCLNLLKVFMNERSLIMWESGDDPRCIKHLLKAFEMLLEYPSRTLKIQKISYQIFLCYEMNSFQKFFEIIKNKSPKVFMEKIRSFNFKRFQPETILLHELHSFFNILEANFIKCLTLSNCCLHYYQTNIESFMSLKLTSLIYLNLRDNWLMDEQMKLLSTWPQFKKLKYLDLSFNRFSGKTFEYFTENSSLESVEYLNLSTIIFYQNDFIQFSK